jgi:Kef-type K+ transport system membrane component KefB/Trk K+ transport system NAD-binding subunit
MEQVHALAPAIVLLIVGILSILLTRPARLSPIVGYLLAGIAIGPHGLNLVQESRTTALLAELGVVFLLFDIGIHFSLGHLWDARRDILGLGPLQVTVCGGAFALLAVAAGFTPASALVIGATLALSSTAVAVQTLADYGQQSCPIGVSATAVLIFQDICAIFLLILAASLQGASMGLGMAIASAGLRALLAFFAAVLLGRFFIGPVFRLLSRSRNEEVFTATALLIALLAGTATAVLGLSLTLGAFLGGMILSETPYRHVIRTEVKPFRGLLLGFFFITIGMSLDIGTLLRDWTQVLLFLALLLGIKGILVFLTARALGMPERGAVQLGSLLSQGSEFAFVVFAMPALKTSLGTDLSAVLMATVAASLALTPLLAGIGHRIATRLAAQDIVSCAAAASVPPSELEPVVIFGMGEVGRRVADGLEAHGIPYTAVEMDHERFVKANADGYPVAFGDLGDLRLMETLQIAGRSTVAVTIARYELSRELTPVLRERYPRLTRFVAVDSEEEKARFDGLGMRAVVSRSFPKGLDLAAAVLKEHGISDDTILEWMRRQQEQSLELAAAAPVPVASP